MTDRLDRIEAAIADLTNALDVVVSQFIRPTAQQSAANFERLERIESAIEQMVTLSLGLEQQIAGLTQQLSATSQQQQQNTEAIADNARAIASNARLFENMLQENRADRSEWRDRLMRLEREAS